MAFQNFIVSFTERWAALCMSFAIWPLTAFHAFHRAEIRTMYVCVYSVHICVLCTPKLRKSLSAGLPEKRENANKHIPILTSRVKWLIERQRYHEISANSFVNVCACMPLHCWRTNARTHNKAQCGDVVVVFFFKKKKKTRECELWALSERILVWNATELSRAYFHY